MATRVECLLMRRAGFKGSYQLYNFDILIICVNLYYCCSEEDEEVEDIPKEGQGPPGDGGHDGPGPGAGGGASLGA